MANILIYSDNNMPWNLLQPQRNWSRCCNSNINDNDAAQALVDAGAEVFNIENDAITIADTAAVASALAQAVEQLGADTVLLSSNRRGKEIAGRLAQIINAGCLTDVAALQVNGDKIECQRNALGGPRLLRPLQARKLSPSVPVPWPSCAEQRKPQQPAGGSQAFSYQASEVQQGW